MHPDTLTDQPIPAAASNALKLDADEEKLAKAGRAGADAGNKLRDKLLPTPDPRRLLDALIEDLEAASLRLKVSREEVSHELWIRLTAIREAMDVVAIFHGDPFAEPPEGVIPEGDPGHGEPMGFLRRKPTERSDRNTGAMCGTCVSLLIPVSKGYPCDGCGSEGDEPGFDD